MNSRGEGSQGSLRRRALMLFAGMALVALVVGSIFGDKGFLQLMEQRRRAGELEQEVVDLRHENARLDEEIQALRSDARAVERVAREQLGLARPGETVFLLTEPEGAFRP